MFWSRLVRFGPFRRFFYLSSRAIREFLHTHVFLGSDNASIFIFFSISNKSWTWPELKISYFPIFSLSLILLGNFERVGHGNTTSHKEYFLQFWLDSQDKAVHTSETLSGCFYGRYCVLPVHAHCYDT